MRSSSDIANKHKVSSSTKMCLFIYLFIFFFEEYLFLRLWSCFSRYCGNSDDLVFFFKDFLCISTGCSKSKQPFLDVLLILFLKPNDLNLTNLY